VTSNDLELAMTRGLHLRAVLSCFTTLLLLSGSTAIAAKSRYVGQFADVEHATTLELSSTDGVSFTGWVTKGSARFPITLKANSAGLTGAFKANDASFDCAVTPDGDDLLLTSGTAKYRLKRVGVVAAARPDDAKPATQPGAADPLAYRILKFPGGTVAAFDNWKYADPQVTNGIIWGDGSPAGKEVEFRLRAAVAPAAALNGGDLFVAGPQMLEQLLAAAFGPVFQRVGQPEKALCGGDEALVIQYAAKVNGNSYTCRGMWVKRKETAIGVTAIGTDEAFKTYGRSIEIVAQSITLKESDVEPGLIGTWVCERFASAGGNGAGDEINVAQARSITIYPNGAFSDSAQSGFCGPTFDGLVKGGNRGRVTKKGPLLVFKYDNGQTWTAPYELFSNGLKLDGKIIRKN
jgi:hypothetical protein